MTKQVTVDTAVLCDICQGKGTHGNSTPVTCDICGGRGEIQTVQRSLLGQVMTSRPCPTCRGVGEVIPDPCHRCGGDGRVRARRDISVKIPAGVGDGMRVRLAAQGEVGPGGGPAGDLYVEVHEQPHDIFVRDGDDLHCTVVGADGRRRAGHHGHRRRDPGRPDRDHHPAGHPARLGDHAARSRHATPAQRRSRRSARPHRGQRPDQARRPDPELLGEVKSNSHDEAQVRSTHTQTANSGGGLFSRLRETFTGR